MTRPLTEEQKDIAAAYVPLARSIANRRCPWHRWRREWHERQERTSVAYLILCMAARDYRPPGPIRFATYVRYLFRLRAPDELALAARIEASPQIDDWGAILDPRDPFRQTDDRQECETLLHTLPARNAEALRLTILDGLSRSEAGRLMKCSPAEVSRLVKQAQSLAR